MKKQWRTILIMGAVLVAIVLVWVGSTLLPGNTDTTETTTTTTLDLPIVFKAAADDVASMTVQNDEATFTLLPVSLTDEDGKTTLGWQVQGMEDLPFSQTQLDKVVKVGTLLYANRILADSAPDLAPYGLDKPAAQVTVKLKTGTQHTISFGRELPSGYFDYAIVDQTGPVYSVASSTVKEVKKPLADFLDEKKIIDIESEALQGLIFSRAKDDLKVEIAATYTEINNAGTVSAAYNFDVLSPIQVAGSADRLNTFVSQIMALDVQQFVAINPDDLTQYGLDAPQYTIVLQTADRAVTLSIGKAAGDGAFYMLSDQVPAVFKIAQSAITNLDMPFIEMIERLFALKSIWLVDQVKVNLPGAVFTTEINMPKSSKTEDEEVTFLLNGQNAKIFNEKNKSLFSSFYQRIIALQIAGEAAEDTPVNTHDGSITYYMKADTENNEPAYTQVIEFARRDDYTYYVFIDGTYTGFYIDGNKAFTSRENGSEGIVTAYKMMMYAIEHAVDGVFNTEEGYQLD